MVPDHYVIAAVKLMIRNLSGLIYPVYTYKIGVTGKGYAVSVTEILTFLKQRREANITLSEL